MDQDIDLQHFLSTRRQTEKHDPDTEQIPARAFFARLSNTETNHSIVFRLLAGSLYDDTRVSRMNTHNVLIYAHEHIQPQHYKFDRPASITSDSRATKPVLN